MTIAKYIQDKAKRAKQILQQKDSAAFYLFKLYYRIFDDNHDDLEDLENHLLALNKLKAFIETEISEFKKVK